MTSKADVLTNERRYVYLLQKMSASEKNAFVTKHTAYFPAE